MKSDLVTLREDGQAVTTSLLLAKVFGKRHQHVLRDIKRLECSEEFRVSNFGHTSYTNSQNGQAYPMFEITKDGFSFLALGFTGEKAAVFKERYISEFNRLSAMSLDKGWIMAKAVQYMQEDIRDLQGQVKEKDVTIRIQAEMLQLSAKQLAFYTRKEQDELLVTTASIAKELGMMAVSLHQILEQAGVLYRKGSEWKLYTKHRGKGYTVPPRFGVGGGVWQGNLIEWTKEGRDLILGIVEQYKQHRYIYLK